MRLRPVAARWFELLTDREHLGAVLARLAATGVVELEVHSSAGGLAPLPDYRGVLGEFAELTRRYAPFWPAPVADPGSPPPESLAGARDALAALRAWVLRADPLVVALETVAREEAALAEVRAVIAAAGATLPDLQALTSTGTLLAARLYASDPATVCQLPAALLWMPIAVPPARYLLCVGTLRDAVEADQLMAAARGRRVALPAGLPAAAPAALAAIDERRRPLAAERSRLAAQLAALAGEVRLAGLLASFRFLEWLVSHVPQLPATEHFAFVTGWTSDVSGQRIVAALADEGLPRLLHFPDPPRTLVAPLVLDNPRYLQPFETFVRLLGTPGAGEADPTVVVALIAPLLFGYMFGDVGQGLVLVALGLALRRRAPGLRLLVPGGVAAIGFGLAFGSVFGREDLLPALWQRPLEAPLTMLGVSVAFGVLVLGVGFALEALQHAWAGRAGRWLLTRAGLVAFYLGLVLAPLDGRGLPLAGAGALWFVFGTAIADRRLAAAGSAAGELAETAMQLIVNTISFARVGAFALAHAGLAAAVVGIANATGNAVGFYVALALGNALMLVLEGLVVGIQTTRLVLFEFFIRFLRAEGRPFRSLPEPTRTVFKESS